MTQANPIIGADRSGLQYRTEDNDGKRALLNHHKGANAPTYAESGMLWLDDSITPWLMKLYDGTDWIILGEFNATTNNFAPYVAGSVVGSASTTAEGIIELATQAEVDAGTDTTRAVTPATLAGASIGGKVIGYGYVETGAFASTTNAIPYDDTIPQITEGAEALSISYTPQSNNSKIFIKAGAVLYSNGSGLFVALALFDNSNSNAIATSFNWCGAGIMQDLHISHVETNNSTTAKTYSIRYGEKSGTATYLNGDTTGRKFGGTFNTYIEIIELEV